MLLLSHVVTIMHNDKMARVSREIYILNRIRNEIPVTHIQGTGCRVMNDSCQKNRGSFQS